jgi:hypothetical protein
MQRIEEALIGGDELALSEHCQCQVATVIDGAAGVERNLQGRFEK